MKNDTIRRFAFIETRLLYGGGITARKFGEIFGISRQAAQKVIKDYASLHPGNIKRDLSKRCQVASEEFTAEYIRQDVRLFLDHLRGQALSGFFHEVADWSEELTVEDIGVRVQPKVPAGVVHNLLLGLYHHLPVHAEYRSKSGCGDRLLSPHAIIYAHNRYAVRCYCHFKSAYLDFNLSRFIHTELATENEWVSGAADTEWHTFIELCYLPNPELPLKIKQALQEDYQLNEEEPLLIHCRQATAFYIKKEMEGETYDLVEKWVQAGC